MVYIGNKTGKIVGIKNVFPRLEKKKTEGTEQF